MAGDGLNGSKWPLILVGLALTIFGATAGPLVDIGGDRARLQEATRRIENLEIRVNRIDESQNAFSTMAAERGIRLYNVEERSTSIVAELQAIRSAIQELRDEVRSRRDLNGRSPE